MSQPLEGATGAMPKVTDLARKAGRRNRWQRRPVTGGVAVRLVPHRPRGLVLLAMLVVACTTAVRPASVPFVPTPAAALPSPQTTESVQPSQSLPAATSGLPVSPSPSPLPTSSPLPSASAPAAPPRPALAPAVVEQGQPPRLAANTPPGTSAHRGSVTLDVWVPDHRFAVGEWVPIHARITNTGNDRLSLPCDFLIPFVDIRSLFDSGRTWTGRAAAFKKQELQESNWLDGTAARFMTRGELPCGGDVAVPVWLPAHTTWDFDYAILPRYGPGLQPLPAGTIDLDMTFEWQRPGRSNADLSVHVPFRIAGFDAFPYPTPGELVDAVLQTPGFTDWLDSRGGSRSWDTFAGTQTTKVNWAYFGWTTPIPPGTSEIGLFADSAPGGDATVSGSVFIDPYTGYSYGFWSRCANSRIFDPQTFGPSGCGNHP